MMDWVFFLVVIALAAWPEESETRRAEMVVSSLVLLAVLAFLYVINVH